MLVLSSMQSQALHAVPVRGTRSPNENFVFFEVAATALKPSSKDASRCKDSASIKDLSVRASCVELWRFYWSIRISVPMLYITF